MPFPSSALTTLRPDLGGSLLEYELDMVARGMVGLEVLPVFEAAKASGQFGKIPVEQLLKNPDTARAPGAAYNRDAHTFTTDTFATVEYGVEEPVDDNASAMYREFFNAESIAAARARSAVMLAQEIRIAAAIFNATTWTSHTTAITNEWDDMTNAVPITDVAAAVKAVNTASGMWPNALIINERVFRNLIRTDQIVNLIKYAGITDPRSGTIIAAALAQALNIDRVIVAGLSKNTATEGQSATFAPVWSDEYAMVCKLATGQDIAEPCIGRTIHWGEDGSQIGATIESYRDESRRSDIIRVRNQVDEKVLFVEGGHLLSNVTT